MLVLALKKVLNGQNHTLSDSPPAVTPPPPPGKFTIPSTLESPLPLNAILETLRLQFTL